MTEREHMERTANCELALAVRGISKYYGRFCAVNNLTFGVRPDECFGLLGFEILWAFKYLVSELYNL